MRMRFTNLVLGGGAAKCTAYLGFFDAAPEIEAVNIVGVSAGAIVAYVLALGMPRTAALDVISRHGARPWDLDIGCLLDSFGMADNKASTFALVDELTRTWWWDAMMLGECGEHDVPPRTFLELGKRTGKNLVVPAVDVDAMRTVFFSMDTHPDLDVRLAIAASCAVPFLFSPVVIDGRRFVDGCLLQSTPLEALPPSLAAETLVLQVFARNHEAGKPGEAGACPPAASEESIFSYGKRVVAAFMNRETNKNTDDAVYYSITVSTDSIGEMLLDGISADSVYNIFMQGVAAGKHFLKTYKHVHAVPAAGVRGGSSHRGRHVPPPRPRARAKRPARHKGGDAGVV